MIFSLGKHIQTAAFLRAIALPPNVRHYTPKFLLKTIYYFLFNFHLFYPNQIWGQVDGKTAKIQIINFLPFNSINIKNCYNDLKCLKLSDFIQNSLFVKNCLKRKYPTHSSTTFKIQGLNIPIERVPHLKALLLHQKLTQKLSNISVLI